MSKRASSWIVLVAASLFSAMTFAAIDTFTFDDEATQERYKVLVKELRCPKCDGQSIGDSNAPIANDLRRLIFKQLESGATDRQVVDFMVDRYGEFVLYRPKTTGKTQWLWYGPIAFGVVGFLVLVTVVVRSRRQKQSGELVDDIDEEKLIQVRRMLDGDNQTANKSGRQS
ncbi:cytochrome c-type biogenesis protein [Parendozoicomonas sp. Alg238-R29]|uniref:cytochrome c-type biogenesis protein n=1 Tax=Parendozoicomonas sp. Alg238-R29 TaxID=2993446 RepID=UPI00248EF992|nr:cytochrome c-type biogenesis protein [Parendozoicomonas sp. Alg238-R29]